MSADERQFRIDQSLWTEGGQELARFSVVGPTLETAMMSSQLLTAPHIATGLITQVARVGYYCPKHKCYHNVADALRDEVASEAAVAAAESGRSN